MTNSIFNYQVHNEIAVITIDSPPVNALGVDVRTSIANGFKQADQDDSVKAIILTCAGRTFHAGADIKEFGKPPLSPSLRDIIEIIESIDKLSVAAIHGTALGGGLELSLGCHARVALRSAKVGLPEVNLGILPGAGGTQKLPRIVGIQKSLELICGGQMIGAVKAHELGILDELVDDDLVAEAITWTRKQLASDKPLTRVRDRNDKLDIDRDNTEIFNDFRKANARKHRGFLAPENIIKSIESTLTMSFEKGMIRERELFSELMAGTQAGAQRHAFFAERETSKVPDIPKDTPVRSIDTAAVIGAGTMGGGIAMNFLNAGIPVILMEQEQAALDRGIDVIRSNYARSLKRGKISQQQLDERMALMQPTLDIQELADADLIIEAVFEDISVKESVFKNLDKVAKQGCILASNTSYLDLNQIANATSRPEDVIGMHFFSPANVMPLLEVVRGEKSSLDAINTAMRLSKALNKTPVLSRVGFGFIANRVMTVRGKQAVNLILQGVSPELVDQVIFDYGFAIGPFAMKDLVGLDVTNRGVTERTVDTVLVSKDRLGQKKNGGYYDYDENRNRTLSPIALDVIAEIAAENNVKQIECDEEEILARLLYPIINEGAKVLDEGVAIRSSDIDIACIKGYNWPVYQGGPMYWANTIGLDKVLNGLRDFELLFGEEFTPSPYLIKLVEQGQQF